MSDTEVRVRLMAQRGPDVRVEDEIWPDGVVPGSVSHLLWSIGAIDGRAWLETRRLPTDYTEYLESEP